MQFFLREGNINGGGGVAAVGFGIGFLALGGCGLGAGEAKEGVEVDCIIAWMC